ncbi:MAG: riboflavin synthase [Planctomycetota bacterium]
MFTGLIEHRGRVTAMERISAGARLLVDIGPLSDGCRIGDSIAVNGSCLTVTSLQGGIASFDVSAETLRATTMQDWRAGQAVNLERALRLGDRLGGHLVSGHVDGVGRLQARRVMGGGERFTFLLPENDSVKVVEKGSIAIDGISLTCYDCQGRRFSVAVIPHSLGQTTLQDLRPGAAVNLEQDAIGRWVERLMGGSS